MTVFNEEQILKNQETLSGHYRDILSLLGEDPEREGLLKTPLRVAKAMQFLTKGYREDPEAVLRSAMFQEEDYKQMVIVKDIDFFSLCEHHMLPFFGKAHVAYIPKKYITGLSKIPRVVDIFARNLLAATPATRSGMPHPERSLSLRTATGRPGQLRKLYQDPAAPTDVWSIDTETRAAVRLGFHAAGIEVTD